MDSKHHHSPDPPSSSSSSLLRDVSNFRTPKNPSKNPNFHSPRTQFFTASKETPRSSSSNLRRHRPSLAPSASASARSKVVRRLKAFEIEQSKSARKAQIDKENSLRSLAKSLTAWLNFLLQDPTSCGCDLSKMTGEGNSTESHVRMGLGHGKRESCTSGGVGVDTWRCPKRMRGSAWHAVSKEDGAVSNSKFLALQSSLEDVCSFDDLHQRMKLYLSLGSCQEIFNVMTQVTKNIDEGRLKMKANCPIVADVGMKEKASTILMCYNPSWLRIGLYIIFGGDSLLPHGDVNSEKEIAFLKMVMEKQFFSHAGLARVYAFNKFVEGLYRPGYFETLGNVILKRFLLLALILDRAKSQSCLPIKYGIDGLDGGSPLLFTLQSNIKSSRQVICDFLSPDVMHGEGNLFAHLLIVGYRVSYQQSPLNEYDFRVTKLFEDLRDGVRLCRAIQLLQHDTSILMKIVVPSDSHKKNVVNCGIAMQHLKQAGVPIVDEDGSIIVGEDIVSGDKELTLSLLWNIFVHLQLPLLIDKTLLLEEISRIRGANVEHLHNSSLLDILLNWIQAICERYNFRVDGFASLVDGKAMWCLLEYYMQKEPDCSCSLRDITETSGGMSIVSVTGYTDAVHNLILSQILTILLGNFPEVLQVSDILGNNGACNSQSVVILLVFLSFQLIVRKNTDQLNFHKLVGFSCRSLERKCLSKEQCFVQSEAVPIQEDRHGNSTEDGITNFKAITALESKRLDKQPRSPLQCLLISTSSSTTQRENAAKVIQSHFRRSMKRSHYLQIKNAVSFLQTVTRTWLAVKRKPVTTRFCTSRVQDSSCERWKQSETLDRYITYMVDRHSFVKLKRSVEIIQHATRAWISRKYHGRRSLTQDISTCDAFHAAIIIQKCIRGWKVRSVFFQRVAQLDIASLAHEENKVNELQTKAASTIQLAWQNFIACKSLCHQHLAATKIQSCYHGWFKRKSFVSQKQAAIKIQSVFRLLRCLRDIRQSKIATRSAIVIQSHARGWIAQRGFRRLKCIIIVIQRATRTWISRRHHDGSNLSIRDVVHAAIVVQKCIRGLKARSIYFKMVTQLEKDSLAREENEADKRQLQAAHTIQLAWKQFQVCKSLFSQHLAAAKIQSCYRGWSMRKSFVSQKQAAIKIQSVLRCLRCLRDVQQYKTQLEKDSLAREENEANKHQLQAAHAWKKFQVCKSLFGQHLAATKIQSCYRGWSMRKSFVRKKQAAIKIQSVLRCLRCLRDIQQYKIATRSAVTIQSHFRGWISRRGVHRLKCLIVVIQSYWKGYLARKDSKGKLLDLRLRVQKSAANVDDSMRIINRLLAALSDLLSMKSVSGILHTCATLDMATRYSQKCCEKLVEAGAIDTLLKLIRSVSRSIPDQEVRKHALSTLRNLARYSHLADVLIGSCGSLETILLEFLRNKEDGYFIASELLKKICSSPKGREAIRNSPPLLKRLHNLVEDLTRKAGNEKRNARGVLPKEQVEKRLREAVELLNLITNG